MTKIFLILVLSIAFLNVLHAKTTTQMTYKGMNIAGAEFNGGKEKAEHYKDYLWPTNGNLEKIKGFGFDTVRIPFRWERMQPGPFNDLDKKHLGQLLRIVKHSHVLGLNVVIDPHNYGRYKGKTLQDTVMDQMIFADFWKRLAEALGDYPNVIFGLMNEPHKQTAPVWASLAQAGVNGIRQAGAEHLILVPGTRWSGMHSWLKGGINSNATALVNIVDPVDNYAYEMHQYFDKDSSGTHQECIASDKIVKKFELTTAWLKANNKKAFLGEFGVPENKACILALTTALDYMKKNQEQWLGWTYWATSNWMANYPYNFFSKKSPGSQRLTIMKRAVAQ